MPDHTPNPVQKRCCRGDKCVHPDGPVLIATGQYFGSDKTRKDGLYPMCRECSKFHTKQYRMEHPEPVLASQKRTRDAHKDAISAWKKGWYRRNRATVLEQRRNYYLSQRDRIIARVSHSYHRDLDKSRAQVRQRYKANPQKVSFYRRVRESRKLGLPATFTRTDWLKALEYFHGACAYCGNPPSLFDHRQVLCHDHYIPVIEGGGYSPDNIIPACNSCNCSKSGSDPIEWLNRRFGTRKAKRILSRIQAYFNTLKEAKP